MPDISKDIILLLQYLLPGFLVSWVFYGLTSHIKPSQFERVVQALIYTMLVHLCIAVTSFCLSWLGNIFSIGSWTKNTDLFFSLLYAVLIGLSISLINNKNYHISYDCFIII